MREGDNYFAGGRYLFHGKEIIISQEGLIILQEGDTYLVGRRSLFRIMGYGGLRLLFFHKKNIEGLKSRPILLKGHPALPPPPPMTKKIKIFHIVAHI